jgi:hypothetical protein
MLVFGLDGSGSAEVNSHALTHDGFAIKDCADSNGSFLVKEGYDYAAHTLKWCPGVNGGGGVDELFDSLEVVGAEDLGILKIGNEEGIRWRRWGG